MVFFKDGLIFDSREKYVWLIIFTCITKFSSSPTIGKRLYGFVYVIKQGSLLYRSYFAHTCNT